MNSLIHSSHVKSTWILLIAACLSLLSINAFSDSKILFIHNDHLGTPQMVTDETQSVVWTSQKLPFGQEHSSGSIEQLMRFPGQIEDDESGYHQNYYRDYDPSLGRYIQSDPIGLEGGMNTYAYVEGNPLLYIDPKGLRGLVVRPRPNNPWNRFQQDMSGRGFSQQQMLQLYRQSQLNRLGQFSDSDLHRALEDLPDRTEELFGPQDTLCQTGTCLVQVQVCSCKDPNRNSQGCSPYDNSPGGGLEMRATRGSDPNCSCWIENRRVSGLN